ncbi:MAG: fibronectin type III domain-containing protein [Spirochaetes bacterium]|nr:MAG: fibronectin type III domain-containing protein [Spirochaetota bacterium]
MRPGKHTVRRLTAAFFAVLLACGFLVPFGCFQDNFSRDVESVNDQEREEGSSAEGFPEPGNGGAITISAITFTSLQLKWLPGIDTVTLPAELRYQVYCSKINNIHTLEDIDANLSTVLLAADSYALSTFNITGLIAGTSYYFNVVVTDADGNRAAYTSTSGATLVANGIFLFSPSDTYNGNLMAVPVPVTTLVTTSVVGTPIRDHLDAICVAVRANDFADLPCTAVHAFISTGEIVSNTAGYDSIKGMPETFGLPVDQPVRGPGPAFYKVADNWADLFDADELAYDLLAADIAGQDWWSGSLGDGSFATDPTGTTQGYNCNGWSVGNNSAFGRMGKKTMADSHWISDDNVNCNTPQRLLCACW